MIRRLLRALWRGVFPSPATTEGDTWLRPPTSDCRPDGDYGCTARRPCPSLRSDEPGSGLVEINRPPLGCGERCSRCGARGPGPHRPECMDESTRYQTVIPK